jgi:DHA2 family multidrug resistance protein-like MFS transporter
MIGVALPTIGHSFAEAPAKSLLVVTAYQLALLVGLLPCAHVADSVGYRRLFLTGILTFAASATLCAIAPTFSVLVVARFFQGLGGSAVMALGIALLRSALSPQRFAAAIGWNALVVALCSAIGPTVGALLMSLAGWRWLFVISFPIAVAALVAARALPPVLPRASRIDQLGILLYAAAAACIVVGAESARQGPIGPVLLGAAALLFGAWLVGRERRKEAPLVPLDLLALQQFRASATASAFFFTGQSAGLLALPFYLQLSLGHSATTAGFILTLWPLAVATISTVAGKLTDRYGSGKICGLGGLVLTVGLSGTALVPANDTILPLAVCVAASGAGFGLFQVPNNRTMFLAAPPSRSAAAGGMQGTARLTGQTAGALLVSFVLSAAPMALAPRLAFGLAALAALIAALVSRQQNVTVQYSSGIASPPLPNGFRFPALWKPQRGESR